MNNRAKHTGTTGWCFVELITSLLFLTAECLTSWCLITHSPSYESLHMYCSPPKCTLCFKEKACEAEMAKSVTFFYGRNISAVV